VDAVVEDVTEKVDEATPSARVSVATRRWS
jgi:hypothetical protein